MAGKKTVRKATPKSDKPKAEKKVADRTADGTPPRATTVQRAVGPSARNCPLVLDGEVDASDFSPRDCQSCSEFDCRFCQAEEGSGTLRSRLFAGEEEDGDEDDFGSDFAPDSEEGGEEDDSDLF